MTLTDSIQQFFESEAGQLAVWVLLLPVLDFALGIMAAVRDNTFQLDVVAAWLRKHVAGRMIPIWVLLFVGFYADQWVLPVVNFPAIMSIGVAAAGIYVAETAGSILRSWGPTNGPALLRRDATQPTPED